jgi:serine/threonine protein kinase
LLRRIGAGAYGEVWLARNTATQAERAVKIVYRATFADERPFQREFEGIKRFDAVSRSHPTQLALFHVGKGDGFFYYIMELADRLPGSAEYRPHTLRGDLESGRLPAAQVVDLGLTLAEALHHLHAAGLIHRDVKPSNIIYVRARPKLADIGLVTDASDSQSIVGTEGYLPREGPGTPAADLFALGKVLYETVTGLDRRQFPELPADMREWTDAKVAFELNTIILKLCAADSKARYAGASEAISDFQHLGRGKSVQSRRWFRHTATNALKAVSLAALICGAFLFYRHKQPPAYTDTRKSQSDFAHSGTTNYAAWEASERAGSLAERFSPMGFSNAITYYHRALQLDPNFAAAWVNLAMAEYLSVEKGFVPGLPALHRSLAAAEKALSLQPDSAAALHWKACCQLALDNDFQRAQPLLENATRLSPRYVWRHNYAGTLWKYGRLDEAEKMIRQVLREAPEQGFSHLVLGFILSAAENFPTLSLKWMIPSCSFPAASLSPISSAACSDG